MATPPDSAASRWAQQYMQRTNPYGNSMQANPLRGAFDNAGTYGMGGMMLQGNQPFNEFPGRQGGFAPGAWPSQRQVQTIQDRPVGSAGSFGSSGSRMAMLKDLLNNNAKAKGASMQQAVGGNMDLGMRGMGGAVSPKQGFGSKIASFASQFKPGGSNIAGLFNQGGKMNSMLSSGKMAGIGAAPAWAIPAAAAAAWQINKRMGQKAHQKDLRKFEDQVRGMTTQQQYESGIQKPTHSRSGGMLGRLFKR